MSTESSVHRKQSPSQPNGQYSETSCGWRMVATKTNLTADRLHEANYLAAFQFEGVCVSNYHQRGRSPHFWFWFRRCAGCAGCAECAGCVPKIEENVLFSVSFTVAMASRSNFPQYFQPFGPNNLIFTAFREFWPAQGSAEVALAAGGGSLEASRLQSQRKSQKKPKQI